MERCGGFRRRGRAIASLPSARSSSLRSPAPSPASLVVSLLPNGVPRGMLRSSKAVADQKDRCVIATVDAA